MDQDLILHIGRRALETALLVATPVLASALLVGVAVAMLQAVTSIRDMTMGMVLKIAAVGVVLMICGGWMMQVAVAFTHEVFSHIQSVGLGG
ncbi:MAG: flagellar biosynthetic protein FliQ [Phycisphaerales bacterium]|jgi:flagellar biosynthesis protein FliQ|nr:flagellar biosynthetic protein FliQ [Phycisphaerales bacterium]